MKIGLFTDCHYCKAEYLGPTRRPKLSINKIREAMNAFKSNNVDIVFCLGDMTDHDENSTKEQIIECFKEAMSLIKSYNIPFYLVPGNHDYLVMTANDMEKEADFKIPPYTVETNTHSFIILDANYRSNMVRFDKAGVQWTDSNLPPHQIEFLKNALNTSTKRCVVLVHENLDPSVDKMHIIKNAEQARDIIKNCQKVSLVIQGHYHSGKESTIDNIPYITLPAMCEGESNSFRILEL
ncbi:MAG: metallophosphoesterase [Clostridia bacterium]|nr:metallophosphoesterase [Clostridia bacterium]